MADHADGSRAGAARCRPRRLGALTLGVDHLAAVSTELAERDLQVGDVTEAVISRIASISDPEGTTITLAEPTARSRERRAVGWRRLARGTAG